MTSLVGPDERQVIKHDMWVGETGAQYSFSLLYVKYVVEVRDYEAMLPSDRMMKTMQYYLT